MAAWAGRRWPGGPRKALAGLARWRSALTVPFLLVTWVVAGVARGPAVWWRHSLSRLWVPHSSFHSAWQAGSPRRWNRRAPRTCLTWPKTGSTVYFRKA
jgi:hypothetical protein